MAALSDAQLWTVCVSQWGNTHDTLTAFCIALAESSGDPTVTHQNTNGSTDYGLFQINSVHSDLLKGGNWQDPSANANMAYQLYTSKGGKFTDWTTFTDGSYARFMSRAQKTQQDGGAALPTTGAGSYSNAAGTPANALDLASVTSGNVWMRIAEFVAGGALMLILSISLIKNTSLAKSAVHVAKIAAVA